MLRSLAARIRQVVYVGQGNDVRFESVIRDSWNAQTADSKFERPISRSKSENDLIRGDERALKQTICPFVDCVEILLLWECR